MEMCYSTTQKLTLEQILPSWIQINDGQEVNGSDGLPDTDFDGIGDLEEINGPDGIPRTGDGTNPLDPGKCTQE